MIADFIRRYPVTITVAGLSLMAFAVPSLAERWQLDFDAVATGQVWRVWSGHLTHYDGQHLFWDLLMFVTLGLACERQYPRLLLPVVLVMAAGISLGVGLFRPECDVYRGLSGVDTGLFVWFAADHLIRCWREKDCLATAAWFVPVAGVLGKLTYEVITGRTLFVDASNFVPLAESHLIGAAIGLMAVGTTICWRPMRAKHVSKEVRRMSAPRASDQYPKPIGT